MMKKSIISIISEYNTHRMLMEYIVKMYEPASKRYFDIVDNNLNKVKEIAQWKKSIKTKFSTVQIQDVTIDGIYGDNLSINNEITAQIDISLSKAFKEELNVEMIVFQNKRIKNLEYSEYWPAYCDEIRYITMYPVEEKNNIITYRGNFKGDRAGKYNLGIRIIPNNRNIDDIIDLNQVYWA